MALVYHRRTQRQKPRLAVNDALAYDVPMKLKGKNALITGGAKRVGRAIAIALAEKGSNILLHFNTSKDEAEKTAAQIRSLGVSCEPFQADLAKAIGGHVVSVSNWERGHSAPSRRMMKKIQEFLDYTPKTAPESITAGLCAWKCEACENAAQLCLF